MGPADFARSIAADFFNTIGPKRTLEACLGAMFDSNVLLVVHREPLQTQEKPRCKTEELTLAGGLGTVPIALAVITEPLDIPSWL